MKKVTRILSEKNNDEEDREDEIPQLIVDCPQDNNLPTIIPTQPIQDTIPLPNVFLSNNDFIKLAVDNICGTI